MIIGYCSVPCFCIEIDSIICLFCKDILVGFLRSRVFVDTWNKVGTSSILPSCLSREKECEREGFVTFCVHYIHVMYYVVSTSSLCDKITFDNVVHHHYESDVRGVHSFLQFRTSCIYRFLMYVRHTAYY